VLHINFVTYYSAPTSGPWLNNESGYQWAMTMDERSCAGLVEGLRFFAAYNEQLDAKLLAKLKEI
jgi:hypothetical protein